LYVARLGGERTGVGGEVADVLKVPPSKDAGAATEPRMARGAKGVLIQSLAKSASGFYRLQTFSVRSLLLLLACALPDSFATTHVHMFLYYTA